MKAPFERIVQSAGAKLRVVGRPMADPRGAIVFVPGFAEHSGRYSRLARELASRGYSTYAYDPRGHGRSTGARGHCPSWSVLADDLAAVVADLEAHGDLRPRRALWASSMGALLAAEWLPRQAPDRFHGAVFVAPYANANFRANSRLWFYVGPHVGLGYFELVGDSATDLEFGLHGGARYWVAPRTSFFGELRYTVATVELSGIDIDIDTTQLLFGFCFVF